MSWADRIWWTDETTRTALPSRPRAAAMPWRGFNGVSSDKCLGCWRETCASICCAREDLWHECTCSGPSPQRWPGPQQVYDNDSSSTAKERTGKSMAMNSCPCTPPPPDDQVRHQCPWKSGAAAPSRRSQTSHGPHGGFHRRIPQQKPRRHPTAFDRVRMLDQH